MQKLERHKLYYKLGLATYLMYSIATRFLQILREDALNVIPYVHLIFIFLIMMAILSNWHYGKIVLKIYLLILCILGVTGFLLNAILLLSSNHFDKFARMGMSIFHALAGGLLFYYCDKYFIGDEEIT